MYHYPINPTIFSILFDLKSEDQVKQLFDQYDDLVEKQKSKAMLDAFKAKGYSSEQIESFLANPEDPQYSALLKYSRTVEIEEEMMAAVDEFNKSFYDERLPRLAANNVQALNAELDEISEVSGELTTMTKALLKENLEKIRTVQPLNTNTQSATRYDTSGNLVEPHHESKLNLGGMMGQSSVNVTPSVASANDNTASSAPAHTGMDVGQGDSANDTVLGNGLGSDNAPSTAQPGAMTDATTHTDTLAHPEDANEIMPILYPPQDTASGANVSTEATPAADSASSQQPPVANTPTAEQAQPLPQFSE